VQKLQSLEEVEREQIVAVLEEKSSAVITAPPSCSTSAERPSRPG
jgi:hypothetical protein